MINKALLEQIAKWVGPQPMVGGDRSQSLEAIIETDPTHGPVLGIVYTINGRRGRTSFSLDILDGKQDPFAYIKNEINAEMQRPALRTPDKPGGI